MRTADVLVDQFGIAAKRKWDCIYVAVDFHGTVFKADYEKLDLDNVEVEFYPDAIEALRLMSSRPDIKLMTYTSSYVPEINAYLSVMANHGIHFDFINSNPDVESGLGDFTKKPYFNVLLDDKAGFDPEFDWKLLILTLNSLKRL